MTRYFACSVLLLALAGAGCSASSSDSNGATAGPPTPAAGSAPVAAAVTHDGRAVTVTGNDTMKFSITEITARPGERVSVTFVNEGTTPKFSMGHNWVLLAGGTDVPALLVAAAEAVTTDYVPRGEHAPRILAASKLLGPKERDTVTFTAPTTPGRYEYICSFPGHYQVGMRGVLIVQ
jgi:azurin